MKRTGKPVARKWAGFAAALICSSATLHAQALPPAQDRPEGPMYRPGEVLVQFKDTVADADIHDAFSQAGLRLLNHIETGAMRRAGQMGVTHAFTSMPVPQAVELLKRLPGIEFAEPNWVYTRQTVSTVDDPYYISGLNFDLWGMYGPSTSPAGEFGSAAGEAWAAGYTGTNNVYIGIIDEGIDYNHPDLIGNVWTNPIDRGADEDQNSYTNDVHGWNFFANNNQVFNAAEGDEHGTHVAGTIAATGADGQGVGGVAWNVKYISGKFLGPDGGTTDAAIRAVDYFTDLKKNRGINIVALNNSWGGGGFSQALLDAITRAANEGILFVAAAGNGHPITGNAINTDNSPEYPACYDTGPTTAGYDSVISVTAIAKDGSKGYFANYGSTSVDLGAPGLGVWSTLPDKNYGAMDGTSMATPHVTGAIALYAATYPQASAAQIREALFASARQQTNQTSSVLGKTSTGGRLNVWSFLNTPPQEGATRPIAENAPQPVSNVSATAAAGPQVHVTWTDNSTSETGFRVLRTDTNGIVKSTIVAAGPGQGAFKKYSDRSVSPETQYSYSVVAYNSANPDGNNSAAVAAAAPVTTPAPEPPPAPPQAEFVRVDTTTKGNWRGVYGADGYNVINHAVSYPAYATVSVSGNLSWTWADGTTETRALQKVAPATDRIAACWYSNSSFTFDVNVNDTVPHRVAFYAVDWDSTSRSQKFEVLNPADNSVLDTRSISGFSQGQYVVWNIKGRVKIRVTLTGSPNAVVSGIFFDTAPASPSGLTVGNPTSSQLTLNWVDNSSNESGFKVERATGTSTAFTQVATLAANTTTFVDSGLAAATSYTYRVRAYNAGGTSEAAEASGATQAPPPPAAPSNLVATASNSRGVINLSWADNSNNESGFRIERASAAGGPFTTVVTVGANVKTYSNKGLANATTYYFRVCAYNIGGDSVYTAVASATTRK